MTVGQEVEAKIIAVDLEKKRVSLSIRALLEPAAPAVEEVAEEVTAADETVAVIASAEDAAAAAEAVADEAE